MLDIAEEVEDRLEEAHRLVQVIHSDRNVVQGSEPSIHATALPPAALLNHVSIAAIGGQLGVGGA
jgi:hypothetical protein